MSDKTLRIVGIPLAILLVFVVVFWTHDWLYLVVGIPALVLLALFGRMRNRPSQ